MPTEDSRDVRVLFERIATLRSQATPFHGTIVRSAGTHYANEAEFLSGGGAAVSGGRWNRRGLRAVYASLDIITATFEAYQNLLEFGFSLSAIRPRVTAGATAKLQLVLDLTSSSIRRKVGFTRNELLEEDWVGIQATGEESWTQAIGRGSFQAGFEALLVPSARRTGGKNIVIFPDNFLVGSQLAPIASSELPPHPSQWPT